MTIVQDRAVDAPSGFANVQFVYYRPLCRMCCSGETEKCSLLEQQKLCAESQLEVLAQRLNRILGVLSVDTVLPSVDEMANKVYYFLLYDSYDTSL